MGTMVHFVAYRPLPHGRVFYQANSGGHAERRTCKYVDTFTAELEGNISARAADVFVTDRSESREFQGIS